MTAANPAAEIERQLPPVDPVLDRIQPTPEQLAELKRAADAEQAKNEPWRANAPPPTPEGVAPPHPGPTG